MNIEWVEKDNCTYDDGKTYELYFTPLGKKSIPCAKIGMFHGNWMIESPVLDIEFSKMEGVSSSVDDAKNCVELAICNHYKELAEKYESLHKDFEAALILFRGLHASSFLREESDEIER